MSTPQELRNVPKIIESLKPGTDNQHVVAVLMPTQLAAKWPSKPWGTSIADIGLAAKDAALYPDYVLVDIEPIKGSPDLYWLFQKLSGPEWTTKTKGVDNLIPQKFRRLSQTLKTEQEVVPDTEPQDPTGDVTLVQVEQQKNTGKATLTTISDTINENQSALIGEEYGDIVTKETEEKLVPDGTDAKSGITIISSIVEPLGNGKSVMSSKEVKGGQWPDPVEKEVSKEIPDLIPGKFRRFINRLMQTRKIAASAIPNTVSLSGDEQAKIYKKETPDRAEEKVISQTLDNNDDPLISKIITAQGQVADVAESLVEEGDDITASAVIVDGSVEALGNGKAVKKTVTVPEVFPEFRISTEIPDLIPAKFKVSIPTQTTSEVSEGIVPEELTLADSELSRTEDQLTVFRKRVTSTTRNTSEAEPLFGTEMTSTFGGGLATIEESLESAATAEVGFDVLKSTVEPIGPNQSVKSTTRLEAFPELAGQNYNKDLGVDLPFTEQVIHAGELPPNSDVDPIDLWRSKRRTYDLDAIKEKLLAIHLQFPSQEHIQLPSVLKSVKILASRAVSNSNSRGVGQSFSISNQTSLAVSADLNYEIEEGYSGPVAAEVHVFFLPVESTTADILGTVNAEAWPAFKPISSRIVIAGNGLSKHLGFTRSVESASYSEEGSVQAFTNVAVLPPTLHDSLGIEIEYHDFVADSANADTSLDDSLDNIESSIAAWRAELNNTPPTFNGEIVSDSTRTMLLTWLGYAPEEVAFAKDYAPSDSEIAVTPSSLAATSPTSVTPGRYLKESRSSLYGYGLVQVTAVVIIIE